MKKNKLHTVNRPVFMPNKTVNVFDDGGSAARWDLLASKQYGANYGDAGHTLNDYMYGTTKEQGNKNWFGISKVDNPFSKGNIKNTFGGGEAAGVASALSPIITSAISNGYSTGVGNGIANLGNQVGSAIPGIWGRVVQLGTAAIGGAWNAGFGVKWNEDLIKGVKSNADAMEGAGNALAQASTNEEVLDAAKNMGSTINIDYHNLGSTGFLRSNNALKREEARLNKRQSIALARQNHGLMLGANNADRAQDDSAQSTFVYSDGGSIHIDPSKKGTFTAAASKHGMGVQEFASKVLANKEDYSPTMVKKANFAKNAAKWHDYGGPLNYLNTGALGIMQNDKYLDAINHRSDAIMGKSNSNASSSVQTYFGNGGDINDSSNKNNPPITPTQIGLRTSLPAKYASSALLGDTIFTGVPNTTTKVIDNEDGTATVVYNKGGLEGRKAFAVFDDLLNRAQQYNEEQRMLQAEFNRGINQTNTPYFAFGGELGTNGTDWTNGLLYVDEGGTHEQNPLGGVPVGFDQNGTPNLVEEGETIWNDYVFSNRIKVPKAMFHTLGLGRAMKKNKLTFADASKKLAKESEQRPNDPISMAGLEASLSKLAAVQEAERMKKQMRESVGLENKAAYGGPLGNVFAGPGDRANIIKSIPKNVNRAYPGQIEAWLRDNYIDLEEEDIRDIAQTVYRDYSRAEREKEFLEDAGVSDASALSNIERVGMQMALDRPFEIGPIYSQTLSELKQRPIFDLSESNFEDHIRKAMRAGMSFDEAWRFVDADRMKGDERTKARRKERIRKDLENDLKINPSSNTETVTDTPENVSAQQPEQLEAQAALSTNPELKWGIQNAMQEAARQEAERNYLAGLTPNERDIFNSMLPSQRQEVLRQVSQGISAGVAPSSGSGYAGTSGARGNGNTGIVGNRNTGFTKDMAFVSSLDDMFNGTYGFTPSNGAQYIPYTGMSEAEVREIENDPRFQSWTNRVNDNFYNEKDVEVQNYLRQLDKAAGGNHLFDANGNLRSDAKDYYNRARTQNHLMGWYHLTPLFEKAAQASGEPQIMSAEEEEAARNNAAMQPSSNLPRPTGANGETSPGVDLSGRTSPIDEKRPLLPTWMRYAPVFGGAAGVLGDLLGLTNKPDYTYADKLEAAANAAGYTPNISAQPIGDYIRYSPFDRLFYANQLQANARATDRALTNTSAPSRAAGLLANAYNTTNSLGNLYRQGEEYNLAQRQQTADFNRRTNMFNSQMGLEAEIANARYRQMAKNYQMEGLGRAAALRDAIDQRVGAARSANLTNFFNSLGNIGRENFTFNQINQDPSRSYGYTTPWKAEIGYWPKEFDSYIDKEVQRRMEEERKKSAEAQKATQSTSGAYGGKLKRNKK